MASLSPPPPSSFLVFLLLIASAAANGASSTINSEEFDGMLQSLRNYGYTLFTNSIATSDLKYQLLAASSNFTLFAPRDELLYALDMATDAAVYVSTLRYHIVPNRRHTFAELKNLAAPFLDTLLPHFAILIRKVRDVDDSTDRPLVGVIVDGVRLSFPDLFIGSRIVVHGIDGILLTGLNMSREPTSNDNGSDHNPPVRSPAPDVDANVPAENHGPTGQFGQNNVSPSPASAFDGDIPAEIHAPSVQFGWNYVSPAPASAFDGNIPAEGTLSPNSQFDSNNVPVAPASDGNIPVEGTLNPNVPTPRLSGNIPSERTPTNPTSQFDRNHVLTPPAFTNPAKRSSTTPVKGNSRTPTFTNPAKRSSTTPVKGSSRTPASQIGRNHVRSAPPARTLTPPRSHFHWSNIPAAATPRITQDQKEKMKRFQRNHPGNAQLKGRRRHHHHHRRRRAVGDL